MYFNSYAAMAQQVEHVLGKDEVTSSNLVSSSINGIPFRVSHFSIVQYNFIILYHLPCALFNIVTPCTYIFLLNSYY